MDAQIVKRIIKLERSFEAMAIPEKQIDLISPFLALPGLRGFWPMSAIDSSGNAQDQSGHGHHLSYQGNPTYNSYLDWIPYIDLDGTGDYLSLADTADLDITGTAETYVDSSRRGLTLGGWFRSDNMANNYMLMSKNSGAANKSYWLEFNGLETRFSVSSDGTAETQVVLGQTLASATWYFCVGRFDPSTELKVWTNAMTNTTATAIPASIKSGTADFNVGGYNNGSLLLDGQVSRCFLCAAMLSDAQVSNLFQVTRGAFGV
jgi:hypothetical protein